MAQDGCIGDIILPLGCFFLRVTVGTSQGPPVPRCTHHSGALYGSCEGRLKLFISPATSIVFHRKFFFSFRSQLSKKFMSGIRNFKKIDRLYNICFVDEFKTKGNVKAC